MRTTVSAAVLYPGEESAIMAYVITNTCTKDALCIDACPTDCIHPRKDEPRFEAATQLYVDFDNCIDCGACVGVCPSNSIFVKDELPAELASFVEENQRYYTNA
jgi:ferredoxin